MFQLDTVCFTLLRFHIGISFFVKKEAEDLIFLFYYEGITFLLFEFLRLVMAYISWMFSLHYFMADNVSLLN